MRSIAKRGTTLEFMIRPEPPRRGRTGTQWRYETGWADGGWSRNLEGQYRSWDYGTGPVRVDESSTEEMARMYLPRHDRPGGPRQLPQIVPRCVEC